VFTKENDTQNSSSFRENLTPLNYTRKQEQWDKKNVKLKLTTGDGYPFDHQVLLKS
jgi:hypothetical protein